MIKWPLCGSGLDPVEAMGQEMKKFMVVTFVSFIVVGILYFIVLNLMTWLTKEIEASNRPHHTPPPLQSVPTK